MEIAVCVAILLGLAAAVLAARLFLVRRAVRQIAKDTAEKLRGDTNTPLTVEVRDAAVSELASELNRELSALRAERLRLQNGDREVREAITDISHDLRTPLTAICGYLDLLEREDLPERSARYLSVIRERTTAMRKLTEELFRYSVIVGTEAELRQERVVLNDILEQSLAGFYGTLSERGIVPAIEIPKQPIVRILDEGAVRRIFDNILSNAAKYSDGDLSVRLSADGTATFENSAHELDAVQTAHLFDRFFTVNTARGGTGLGLSIARLLAERSGGTLTAEYRAGRLLVCIRFPDAPS